MEKVEFVATDLLTPNTTKLRMYQAEPENYNSIKDSISDYGILEPLLVNNETNVIVSGNMRHKIAKELELPTVPVIFVQVDEEEMDLKSMITNQQRIKTTYEIFKEIQFYEKKFNVGQGKRTDLNPELQQLKKERDESLSKVSYDKRRKLKKIHEIASELYGEDTPEYYKVFDSIDNGRTTVNGQLQNLEDKKNRRKNETVVPKEYSIIRENTKIYNKSSADMSEVEDNSVSAIICSPPYFQMRDYGNEDELGHENEVEKYLRKMMLIFNECHRVLRNDGSLFVNINDCVINGQYQAVPQRFMIQMTRAGWLFNDEMVWLKNNPQYTKGKRSVRSHEYVYHFVKSPNFYYNDSWLDALKEIENEIGYGTDKKSPKMLSGIDFRDNALKTNASNTSELRKKCAEKGFYLTHSATFPVSVPSICGLLTTKEGDTILDCFNGTGVTGEFARKNGRKFIGYELNPQYILASEVRLSDIGTNWNILAPELLPSDRTMWKLPNIDKKPKFDEFSSLFGSAIDILKKFN